MGKIRLACRFCDRDDCDGLDAIPATWFAVDELQTYEESVRVTESGDTKASVFDWYTHLGVCPECQLAELRPATA